MSTQISFSRVECFKRCKFQYKLRYIDGLRPFDDTDSANNALIIGSAMHLGIADGVKEAIKCYRSKRFAVTNLSLDEEYKLAALIPKVQSALPDGIYEFEHKLETPSFIGYVDLIVTKPNGHVGIYDFKYSNHVDRYLDSAQVHLYKYFYELENPSVTVDELGYIFIPKTSIKQKKTETIAQFKDRLRSEVLASDVLVQTVPYDSNKVISHFNDVVNMLMYERDNNEFPKIDDGLCYFCGYKDYCKNKVDLFMLPQNQKRTVDVTTAVRLFVYGKPYSGKTYFANTFPSPIFLNTDGNINSFDSPYVLLRDEVVIERTPSGRGKTTKITAWQKFENAIDDLANTEHNYKTVVVDLLDDVYEHCRHHMYDELGISHESDDSFKAWDKVRFRFFTALKKLTTLDMNIVLIAHEDSSRDLIKPSGEKVTCIAPNISEKVANKIAGMVDGTARITFINNDHLISFDNNAFGGNRIDLPNVSIKATYDDLIALYKEHHSNSNAFDAQKKEPAIRRRRATKELPALDNFLEPVKEGE